MAVAERVSFSGHSAGDVDRWCGASIPPGLPAFKTKRPRLLSRVFRLLDTFSSADRRVLFDHVLSPVRFVSDTSQGVLDGLRSHVWWEGCGGGGVLGVLRSEASLLRPVRLPVDVDVLVLRTVEHCVEDVSLYPIVGPELNCLSISTAGLHCAV